MMTYIEFGKPQRRLCKTPEDLRRYIRLYNHKADCYRTVYRFERMELDGRPRPDYNSAIVDKVFFDFDGKGAFNNMQKTHEKLLDDNIKHIINFSGNGFHVFVFCKNENIINKKAALKRYSLGVTKKLDRQVAGDLARLVRIPFTYHLQAKRYCIPMDEYDVSMDFYNIALKSTLANQCTCKSTIFGFEEISLLDFDMPEEEDEFTPELVDVNIDINDDLPVCVQQAMSKDAGFFERNIYFTFMRDCGISIKSAIEAVQNVWTQRTLRHCLYEEKQPQRLYKGNITYSKKWKQENGVCYGCGMCGE
jgi:hypothetical protein